MSSNLPPMKRYPYSLARTPNGTIPALFWAASLALLAISLAVSSNESCCCCACWTISTISLSNKLSKRLGQRHIRRTICETRALGTRLCPPRECHLLADERIFFPHDTAYRCCLCQVEKGNWRNVVALWIDKPRLHYELSIILSHQDLMLLIRLRPTSRSVPC